MKQDGEGEVVTFREAARRLGIVQRKAKRRAQDLAAKRLREMVELRQEQTGMRVIGAAVSPRSPCVTVSGIRALCPELRGRPSDLDEVRRLVAHLDEKIDARVMEYVEPRLADQRRINETLASAIRRQHAETISLERRLSALETAPACTSLHQLRRSRVEDTTRDPDEGGRGESAPAGPDWGQDVPRS